MKWWIITIFVSIIFVSIIFVMFGFNIFDSSDVIIESTNPNQSWKNPVMYESFDSDDPMSSVYAWNNAVWDEDIKDIIKNKSYYVCVVGANGMQYCEPRTGQDIINQVQKQKDEKVQS